MRDLHNRIECSVIFTLVLASSFRCVSLVQPVCRAGGFYSVQFEYSFVRLSLRYRWRNLSFLQKCGGRFKVINNKVNMPVTREQNTTLKL